MCKKVSMENAFYRIDDYYCVDMISINFNN